MKFPPRLDYQLPSDTHFWGYAADKLDAARFDGMLADYPLLKQRSPLIEMGLTKKNTHAILKQRGVRRPWVYEIGMPNGNCIGCVYRSEERRAGKESGSTGRSRLSPSPQKSNKHIVHMTHKD